MSLVTECPDLQHLVQSIQHGGRRLTGGSDSMSSMLSVGELRIRILLLNLSGKLKGHQEHGPLPCAMLIDSPVKQVKHGISWTVLCFFWHSFCVTSDKAFGYTRFLLWPLLLAGVPLSLGSYCCLLLHLRVYLRSGNQHWPSFRAFHHHLDSSSPSPSYL